MSGWVRHRLPHGNFLYRSVCCFLISRFYTLVSVVTTDTGLCVLCEEGVFGNEENYVN